MGLRFRGQGKVWGSRIDAHQQQPHRLVEDERRDVLDVGGLLRLELLDVRAHKVGLT